MVHRRHQRRFIPGGILSNNSLNPTNSDKKEQVKRKKKKKKITSTYFEENILSHIFIHIFKYILGLYRVYYMQCNPRVFENPIKKLVLAHSFL